MDEEAARLVAYLREHGASEEELAEAARTGTHGPLALELALRPPGEMLPFDEAIDKAGLELEEARHLWRALGFPDPLETPTRMSESRIETLRVLAGSRAIFGAETSLRLARVIGNSAAQLAEAIVDTFRVNVEMPQREEGKPASEVVSDYASMASATIPALSKAIGDVLVGHLVAVARGSWALDEQRSAVTRELAIGFADLVGYTQTTHRLAPSELASTIDSFESRAAGAVARHGGRVVKLIGDEVMFALEDPAQAAPLVLELLDEQVRIGVASGPVVSLRGDYYGSVVNLAARLAKAARPGTALVSESIPTGGDLVELSGLKGFDAAVRAYALTAPASAK